jgi:hypothetical protein
MPITTSVPIPPNSDGKTQGMLDTEFNTPPNKSVFWSGGGIGTALRDSRNPVRTANHEIARTWTDRQNESLTPGESPYTLMEHLPTGRALDQLVGETGEGYPNIAHGLGQVIIADASDSMSKQAIGVVNVVAFNTGPTTNLRAIELQNFEEQDAVTHFNLIHLVNASFEDPKERWIFNESFLPKDEGIEVLKRHWFEVTTNDLRARLKEEAPPKQKHDKDCVIDWTRDSLSHVSARFLGDIGRILADMERYEGRESDDRFAKKLEHEQERLKECADLILKDPRAIDIFQHQGVTRLSEGQVAPPLLYETIGSVLSRRPDADPNYADALFFNEAFCAEEVFKYQLKILDGLYKRLPDLPWQNVTLHSPEDFRDQAKEPSIRVVENNLLERQVNIATRMRDAQNLIESGDFRTDRNELLINLDVLDAVYHPQHYLGIRQAQNQIEKYRTEQSTLAEVQQPPFVCIEDLVEGKALHLATISPFAMERSRQERLDLWKTACEKLCDAASGTVHVHESSTDQIFFRKDILPRLIQNSSVTSIAVLTHEDQTNYGEAPGWRSDLYKPEELLQKIEEQSLSMPENYAESIHLVDRSDTGQGANWFNTPSITPHFMTQILENLELVSCLSESQGESSSSRREAAIKRLRKFADAVATTPRCIDIFNVELQSDSIEKHYTKNSADVDAFAYELGMVQGELRDRSHTEALALASEKQTYIIQQLGRLFPEQNLDTLTFAPPSTNTA